MTADVLAEHRDDDRHITVSRPRRGSSFQLVLDASDGLETALPFDEVEIQRLTIEFYRRIGRVRYEAGSIERDLDAWGDVGEWIQAHAGEVIYSVTRGAGLRPAGSGLRACHGASVQPFPRKRSAVSLPTSYLRGCRGRPHGTDPACQQNKRLPRPR